MTQIASPDPPALRVILGLDTNTGRGEDHATALTSPTPRSEHARRNAAQIDVLRADLGIPSSLVAWCHCGTPSPLGTRACPDCLVAL